MKRDLNGVAFLFQIVYMLFFQGQFYKVIICNEAALIHSPFCKTIKLTNSQSCCARFLLNQGTPAFQSDAFHVIFSQLSQLRHDWIIKHMYRRGVHEKEQSFSLVAVFFIPRYGFSSPCWSFVCFFPSVLACCNCWMGMQRDQLYSFVSYPHPFKTWQCSEGSQGP